MTTLTTKAPRVKTARKPRPKPARSIRLVLGFNAEGRNAVVRIAVGKAVSDYYLHRLVSDYGTGFRLEKFGSDETYAVNLNGQKSTCECKGFLRRNHCKHVDGLAALVKAGKLEQPAPVDATVAA